MNKEMKELMEKLTNRFELIDEEEREDGIECDFCSREMSEESLQFDYKEGGIVCEDCQVSVEEADNPELILALVEEFRCSPEDIVKGIWGEVWYIDGADYLVLTEDEAEEKLVEHVEETLWAFNASFLSNMTDMPQEVFEALQPQCEGANEAILAIVEKTCGIEELAEEAVRWDGRGHFLSPYDGHEIEISVGEDYYYCYRV